MTASSIMERHQATETNQLSVFLSIYYDHDYNRYCYCPVWKSSSARLDFWTERVGVKWRNQSVKSHRRRCRGNGTRRIEWDHQHAPATQKAGHLFVTISSKDRPVELSCSHPLLRTNENRFFFISRCNFRFWRDLPCNAAQIKKIQFSLVLSKEIN